ncbi:subunit beta of proteasome [Hamiltosporidium magnivora]|uniref:Proteasome subunit beta n=1 Tax=Hamiltosporidium magnivora TaxID=148818 RepID=A0A4Q9LFZ5_9MICR|nr:subunit beta of proteasome [Hamiltosporidium magnivora]TBU05830.1 subunit beta of proteasome [Hamiltosporidium magnivora]
MKTILTGASVIAFKYDKGIILATDTQLSYGSLAKFSDVSRIHQVSPSTLLGLSGEYSDIQYLLKILYLEISKDPVPLSPNGFHKLIQRILYGRRSDLEPLNVQVVVAGGDGTLKAVNHLGNFYSSDVIVTSLGQHLVTPFLRAKLENEIPNIDQAFSLIQEACLIEHYRDTKMSHTVQIATVEESNINISPPTKLNTDWKMGKLEEEEVF